MNLIYIYLLCICAIILAIRFMASPQTASLGAGIGGFAMFLAIISDFVPIPQNAQYLISAIILGALIGIYLGLKIKITSLPQMVALLNGLGGGAVVCIAIGDMHTFSPALILGGIIGAITFSGSTVAFCKLQGILSNKITRFFNPIIINLAFLILVIFFSSMLHQQASATYYFVLIVTSFLWGIFMVLPVGGADMPIIISILNAFSGWNSVAVGFAQQNILLISVGSIIGIGGIILAQIMINAANSSLLKLFFQHRQNTMPSASERTGNAKNISPQDAAFIMKNADKVIIVPGFGMAAASAQHALKNMADILRNRFAVDVKYAIHPVAGRMPGHMNVLLAEANVNYDEVFELEDINHEFSKTDVAYVIGANDITNPDAADNPQSPLFGMPILEAQKAKTVIFVKRTLNSGYSGVDNPLFFAPNTFMLYGDAKKITEEVDKFLEQ